MFVCPKAGLWPALGIFFSLPQEEEKMKWMLNTLNISDFISKSTNYIYIEYIYLLQNTLHGGFFITEHSTK